MGQHRSTQRHVPHGRTDQARLVADMIGPAGVCHSAEYPGAD